MTFIGAQLFTVDPASVANSPTVDVARVDLYFRYRPGTTVNKSGIELPGVTVSLVPTVNGVPVATGLDTAPAVRAEYGEVLTSVDATVPTVFRFARPPTVPTGTPLAVVVSYDGGEDYGLWLDTKGDPLVLAGGGAGSPSLGGVTGLVGPWFDYVSTPILVSNPPVSTSISNSASPGVSASYALGSGGVNAGEWRSRSSVCAKFTAYAARYSSQGSANLSPLLDASAPADAQVFVSPGPGSVTPVANGEWLVTTPGSRMEYVSYSRSTSSAERVSPGEKLFQNTVFYPGGGTTATVAVTAGSDLVVASAAVDWTTLLTFGVSAPSPEYVVITGLGQLGAGADQVAVRRVVDVVNTSVVRVDEPVSFTNSAAYFFRSPVAVVDRLLTARFFGVDMDVLIARDSTANSSMRFTARSVHDVAVTAGGAGYSNSDYVTVSGFESVPGKVLGNYAAAGNLVTNSSGGVTAVYLSNIGAGFTNAAAITVSVSNSTGGSSAGSGATFSVNAVSVYKTDLLGADGTGGALVNAVPVDVDVGEVMPDIGVRNPSGTLYAAQMRFPYYTVDDPSVASGRALYCDADGGWDQIDVRTRATHEPWEFTRRRAMPSWSNEVWAPYANGASSGGLGGSTGGYLPGTTSNACVLTATVVSNNDYAAARVLSGQSRTTFSRYVVNDDYSGENTDQGNAWARGVETKFSLANGALAEDVLSYATCWRPPGTDVLCFARLFNSTSDPDSFDDKDWTMLELRGGANLYSSAVDPSDTIELSWGLQQTPNAAFTLAGSATLSSGNATVSGSATSWATNATANVVVGDLVVLRQPLFPNNYFAAVVTAVANDSALTLSASTSNSSLLGSGLTVEKSAYPRQAFNNRANDNVARYYTLDMIEVDGFDTLQVKVVMLSSNSLVPPNLDDLRVIAVSA